MKVLIIDDEAQIRKTTAIALETAGYETYGAEDSATAFSMLHDDNFRVALLDLKLGKEDGMEILPTILKDYPNVSVIVFTAHASYQKAVEAIQLGAVDFIAKPFTPEQLRHAVRKAGRTQRLERRIEELESQIKAVVATELSHPWKSSAMKKIYDTVRKVAASVAGVLLLGESGTGKSVLARQIHNASPRKEQEFVTVSCPSLTPELLASELFGHVRGAFTGAVSDSWGKVTAADGGTLFLDEIGDLPMDIQPRLLRLLQEREYERVGETKTRKANVRVIAATNIDLHSAIEDGRFREDLYYRLNVISLRMPPLRERMEDLPELLDVYAQEIASQCGRKFERFSEQCIDAILRHTWPGNIRELRNYVERAVILSDSGVIDFQEVGAPGGILSNSSEISSGVQIGEHVTLKEIEKAHMLQILETTKTKEEAATILGIDPATLFRKRKRLENH